MSNYCECHLTNECEWCRITEQNKRYREALQFYADTNNYKLKGRGTVASLVFDRGIRARKALEGED